MAYNWPVLGDPRGAWHRINGIMFDAHKRSAFLNDIHVPLLESTESLLADRGLLPDQIADYRAQRRLLAQAVAELEKSERLDVYQEQDLNKRDKFRKKATHPRRREMGDSRGCAMTADRVHQAPAQKPTKGCSRPLDRVA